MAWQPHQKVIQAVAKQIKSNLSNRLKMAPSIPGKKSGKFSNPKTDSRSLKRKRIVDDHERLEKEIKELVRLEPLFIGNK